ncbi:MAG: hypothetical protein IGR92_04450 [Leptolyngbyaceae cyanobacterium T60_A2020_046]|nr:hypothetical protein [Leptolyngbyaceae cyanobacterium T60_A2020_046]
MASLAQGSAPATQALVLAQFDQDVLGDISSAFRTFIDSGQVWALIIGIVLGYVIRGVTTYR